MLLTDYLLTLPRYAVADIYERLYQPETPEEMAEMSEEELREAVVAYWSSPRRWEELVAALSPIERRHITRLALQEKCPIDAFLEELNSLGLVILHREQNRYELPDDVRMNLLERLPSLADRLRAQEQVGEDGGTPV